MSAAVRGLPNAAAGPSQVDGILVARIHRKGPDGAAEIVGAARRKIGCGKVSQYRSRSHHSPIPAAAGNRADRTVFDRRPAHTFHGLNVSERSHAGTAWYVAEGKGSLPQHPLEAVLFAGVQGGYDLL